MTDPIYLSSLQNPRLKALVARRRRRERDTSQTILIEGYAEVSLALRAGRVPQTVYYAPDLIKDERLGLLKTLPKSVELVVVAPLAFGKIAYRESPDGWLAEFASPVQKLAKLQLSKNPLIMIAEGLEKPGNLGALIRTADAAGVEAVVSAGELTDWLNPNVVRASKATVMTVSVASATAGEAVKWARDQHLQLVVATPEADELYTEVDLSGPVAIVVGTEHEGVSAELKAAADIRVRIPMNGVIDSLNAATAAALVVYEAVRQRAVKTA